MATPGAFASASLTAIADSASETTCTGPTRPGGSKRSRISAWPCADSGGSRYCSERSRCPRPDRFPSAPSTSTETEMPTSSAGRRRTSELTRRPARAHLARLALLARDRGPERAAAERGQQRRQQRHAAAHHHDDPERQQRAHLARGVEVRDAEHEHRGDDDRARGEDRRPRVRGGARHRHLHVGVVTQLVTETGHDQQAVVRARAEHQHDQDRGRLPADRGQVGLHQAVHQPRRDQVRDRDDAEHQRRDQAASGRSAASAPARARP